MCTGRHTTFLNILAILQTKCTDLRANKAGGKKRKRTPKIANGKGVG